MENIVQLLHNGKYSCVISNGGDIRTFNRRGVADLYDLLKNDNKFLEGAVIADKVIGKAAASIMALGGIKEVYADIVSSSALALLFDSGIKISYSRIVPHILNRNQSDWCPLEKICSTGYNPAELLPRIEAFIKNIKA